MPPSLTITSRNDLAQVTVSRSDDVPEVFWSRVLAEWGIVGTDPSRRILVSVERFLSQLAWLGPACRSHKVVLDRLANTRFKRQLRPFQIRDLGTLLALPNGTNFSVPGAGKTAVTYALYECERSAGRVQRLLIVAPLSAFDAWKAEAAECFSDPPVIHAYDGGSIPPVAEECLINYQRLAARYVDIAKGGSSQPWHAVLYESHRMERG